MFTSPSERRSMPGERREIPLWVVALLLVVLLVFQLALVLSTWFGHWPG